MHKVLVVEDEKMLLEAYELILGSQDNIELHVATNGLEAYEECKKHTFDVILLDLMMPELDGVGFLKKAQPATAFPQTKVLIMSNLSSGDMLAEALQNGAHDHVVKSNIGPSELLGIINQQLA